MWNGKSVRFRFGFLVSFLFSLTILNLISATSVVDNRRVDISNCTLQPETEQMKLKLERKIEQNNRLVKLDISVHWKISSPNASYPHKMVWFMTTDATGKHFLSLDDDFIVMSLGTLSYRITDLNISLVQEPEDCLGNLTANDADKLLKFSLLDLPKSQKAVNEDGINILHICTGFAESGGSCCNLSLTGDDIRCQNLLDDKWVHNYSAIIVLLAFILMSHSIYLIPSFVYEEDKDHSYKLIDKDLKLSVKVTTEAPNLNYWTEISRINSPIINGVCDKLDTSRDNATYFLSIKNVKRIDTELVSEFRNTGLLHNLCKLFEYIFLRRTLLQTKCLNVIFKMCVIFFCTSPIIFRTVLSFSIHSVIPSYLYVLFTATFILLVFVFTFLSYPNRQMIKKSLRKFHKFNFQEKTKHLLYYPCLTIQQKFSWITIFCLPLSLAISLILAVIIFLFPIALFILIILLSSDGLNYVDAIFVSLFCCVGIGLITFCSLFYTECIAYILIGLFLNYEQIIDTVLLILLVLTYIFDCLHNILKKNDSFRQTVFKLLFKLSYKPQEQLFVEALARGENTVTAMDFNDFLYYEERQKTNVKVNIGDNEKPFMSVDGLYLFYKFEKPENMPYLYIPQSFIRELASKPGHTTPGKNHILFLKAFREIVFLLLALLAVYCIMKSFARINDVSAIVHTLVTVSSSVALAMLNRLVFRLFEKSSIGEDLYLKEQIKRHAKTFKDIWFDAEFDCSNLLVVGRWHRSDLSPDLLVRTSNEGSIKACYLKPFHKACHKGCLDLFLACNVDDYNNFD